jgi:8-oxo-dGTP pyrophosphatase MutT (NUDIX family)
MTFDSERMRVKLLGAERISVTLSGFLESAVLVPVYCEPGRPERLLLTVRRADLPTHAGQISFPGGKRDPGDRDLAATAMREAAEEIGVPTNAVEILGLLDDVPTPTGFVITPVVARVVGPLLLRPSVREVAELLAPSLDELANPECYHHAGTREFMGYKYDMHEYLVGEHRIWGATARIVWQFLDLTK